MPILYLEIASYQGLVVFTHSSSRWNHSAASLGWNTICLTAEETTAACTCNHISMFKYARVARSILCGIRGMMQQKECSWVLCSFWKEIIWRYYLQTLIRYRVAKIIIFIGIVTYLLYIWWNAVRCFIFSLVSVKSISEFITRLLAITLTIFIFYNLFCLWVCA